MSKQNLDFYASEINKKAEELAALTDGFKAAMLDEIKGSAYTQIGAFCNPLKGMERCIVAHLSRSAVGNIVSGNTGENGDNALAVFKGFIDPWYESFEIKNKAYMEKNNG